MARKGNAKKVVPEIGIQAIRRAQQRTHAWTEYIIVHFRTTGNLAPGCDAVDFYEWWQQYNGQKLEASDEA